MSPGATVDVMLPAYGDMALLREAVRSVLAQDDPRWRLTVIDDAPGSGLESFVAGLGDERVRYLANPARLGINRNFQRCLDEATAELVTIFGADDRLLPGYVGAVLAAADRHPEAAWIHPGVRVIDDAGRPALPLGDRVKGWLSLHGPGDVVAGGERLAASLLRGNWMYFPSIAFRREPAAKQGFTPGYDVVLDLDLYLRMLLAGGEAVLLGDVVFEYRRHARSLSSTEALNGDRFDEEKRYFALAERQVRDAGWPRAARAARAHLTSRLHTLTAVPAALRADRALAARLVRHAVR